MVWNLKALSPTLRFMCSLKRHNTYFFSMISMFDVWLDQTLSITYTLIQSNPYDFTISTKKKKKNQGTSSSIRNKNYFNLKLNSYLCLSWDCHINAKADSIFWEISLATTSLEWTSMVHMVMIFCLSPTVRSPRRIPIRAFSWAIWKGKSKFKCGIRKPSL